MEEAMTPKQAAGKLCEAIHACEEYKTYEELKKRVTEDETNRALLKEYSRLSTSLQVAAMSGTEAEGTEVQRFQQLSSLLYMNQDTAAYLVAQLRLQKLVGEVFGLVAQGSGLELNFPGM